MPKTINQHTIVVVIINVAVVAIAYSILAKFRDYSTTTWARGATAINEQLSINKKFIPYVCHADITTTRYRTTSCGSCGGTIFSRVHA